MLRANWLVAQIYKAREYNALQIGSITRHNSAKNIIAQRRILLRIYMLGLKRFAVYA